MTRTLAGGVIAVLAAALLTVPTSSSQAAGGIYTERKCTSATDEFCVSALTVDGFDVLGGAYEAQSVRTDLGGKKGEQEELAFHVVRSDLGLLTTDDLGRKISVTFQLGGDKPRLFHGTAYDSRTDRWRTGDGWRLTVTGTPSDYLDGCNSDNWPVVCPKRASAADHSVAFAGSVTDLLGGDYPAMVDNLDGVDQVNSQLGSGLPIFRGDGATGVLVNETFAPHFRGDMPGDVLYRGYSRYRIPWRYITENWGIPNPETLVRGSLVGEAGPGSAGSTFTFEQDRAGEAVYVTFANFHFSKRVLRVKRGVVKPTRPRQVSATRTNRRTAVVDFRRAKARGARPTAYQARCYPRSNRRAAIVEQGRRPALTVTGLKTRRVYLCQVRAKSKVGPGRWSKPNRATKG